MADTKEKLVSAAISLLEEGSEEEAGFTMRAIAQRIKRQWHSKPIPQAGLRRPGFGTFSFRRRSRR